MKQVTYTGNDLAREVPTMREPKADDYTDFAFPDSAYYLALEAYGRHLVSLQTFPVLPGHNWIEGQTYEEGRDYVRQEQLFMPSQGGWVNIKNGGAFCITDSKRTVLQPVVNDVASDSKASPSLASHSCTEGNTDGQEGYYYDLFKFFSDNHNLILVDTEIQDIIHAVEKFNNHPVRKIINDTWDGRCRCGHLHSEHRASNSINYSAGRCSVGECRCAHFIIEKQTT